MEPRWLKMAPRWAKMEHLGTRLAHLGAGLAHLGAVRPPDRSPRDESKKKNIYTNSRSTASGGPILYLGEQVGLLHGEEFEDVPGLCFTVLCDLQPAPR